MKTNVTTVLSDQKWMSAQSPSFPSRVLCTPNCPHCAGQGYIRYDVPVGHPLFGQLIPCQNLPPESTIFSGHGLSAVEIKELRWESVTIRENVSDAIRVLKTIAQRGSGMAYLFGDVGLAKTLLLKTLCVEWYRAGRGLYHFTKASSILEDLRTAYDDDEPQRALQDKERKYSQHPLLVIDELGAQRTTEFGVEKIFSLIDARHEAGVERAENIATVMAGNIPPSELDFRVADRLSDGRNFIVHLTGESFRPAMRWKS